jgi:hypothetical protein
MKNIPSPKDKWKAAVKIWVGSYEERFGKLPERTRPKQQNPLASPKNVTFDVDEFLFG